jgi:acetyl esterase/lipase
MSISSQTIKLWNENSTCKQKQTELTVFLPKKPDPSGISVIICPGGSYFWLDMDNEGFSVAKYMNNNGITAFVLRYRTSKNGVRHPAMIQDLQRAIEYVKTSAETFRINPEKVGVMGFSAGGHLAGMAAIYSNIRFCTQEEQTTDISLKPYFAAMIYPVVSMQDSICHKKSRKNLLGKNYSDELKQMMSLEKNVYPDMPPIFLLHCTGDKKVDYRNSVVMDRALTEHNIKHKFLLFDEKGCHGHGFGIRPNGKATGWIDEFIQWIYHNEEDINL